MKTTGKKPLVRYDVKADALYILTGKGTEEEFVEMAPGINIEIDEHGQMLGIEILNASRVLRPVYRRLFQPAMSGMRR